MGASGNIGIYPQPAKSPNRVKLCQIWPNLAKSCHVSSYLSDISIPRQIMVSPVKFPKSGQIVSNLIISCEILPNFAKSCQIQSNLDEST